MSEYKVSVVADLIGNIQQRARQYEGAIAGFSRTGQRMLGGLSVAASGAGRALDMAGNRYVAMVTGGGVVAAGKKVGDFSARLNQLGIDAGNGGDALKNFKTDTEKSIRDASIKWGVGSDGIMSGIEDVVQKTGDIKFASDNVNNLALAVKATGAAGSDIGRVMAELQKMGEVDPKNVLALLDTLVLQGKSGAFTLRDLATEGERIFAAYTPKNLDQVRQMGAVLQTMRGSSANAAETVTSFQAFLRSLNDAQTAKRLNSKGIKLFDPEGLKKGTHELLPLPTILSNIAKYTKGDRLTLGQLFTDADSVKALTRLFDEFKTTGKMDSLGRFLEVRGDGTQTIKDAAENLREFNTQLTRLQEAGARFASSELAPTLGSIADTLSKMDANALDQTLQKTKDWLVLLGGVIVAYKSIQAGIGLVRAVGGGAGATAGPAGAAGAAGALTAGRGPVPVYIVDGPFSDLADRPESKKSRRNRRLTKGLVGATGLGTAAAIGYETGTQIYDNFLAGTGFADAIGRAMARGMAALGSENAAAALKSEVAISIQTEPGTKATIKNKSDNVDAKLRSGGTMVIR